MQPRIDALWPRAEEAIGDDWILADLAHPPGPWLSANFVASVDGAGSHDGRSGGLGSPADKRVFDLLRRPADGILVGAGTVRTEGYGPMRLDDDAVGWRRATGLADHPVFVIVSGRLDLDPRSRIFADAPVRPIVVTTESSPTGVRARLAEVADILLAGDDELDGTALIAGLTARGVWNVHTEGGPTLFGTMLAADLIDELSLTVSPLIEGGAAPRIVAGDLPDTRHLRLAAVLRSESTLLLRYRR
jgi:riboflavin biosynthesis pyrimidine reductase